MDKIDIKSLMPQEVTALAREWGLPPYRGGQIFSRLAAGVQSFEEMTDLPRGARALLEERCFIAGAKEILRCPSAKDGTQKFLFELYDGARIESVLMNYEYGHSLCLSTQAGCRMGCVFCATGKSGLIRNLLPSEMLSQIHAAEKSTGVKIGRLVLMGMGEPLDNYDHVLRFLKLVSSPEGLHMGMRKISLSTCGLVPQLNKLAEENLQLTLSVSLHAPNDETRSRLMPVNRRWNLASLMDSCRRYTKKTGRRISFEYAVIDGQSDTPECAKQLAGLIRGMGAHINIIPLNPVKGSGFHAGKNAARFAAQLSAMGINATVRRTLGADVDAACGQLSAVNS
ncbi:MAG: 23S rRNA (adenine(2503)-C(2))-methyltransferase RlmN [Oscillospiraceae bacterium]|nr:23S rRNA (adenine(2503)-C(2))-methyltransferase RlmN [Oscillospiraceae bacterium]